MIATAKTVKRSGDIPRDRGTVLRVRSGKKPEDLPNSALR
jgi:hypothetical protein